MVRALYKTPLNFRGFASPRSIKVSTRSAGAIIFASFIRGPLILYRTLGLISACLSPRKPQQLVVVLLARNFRELDARLPSLTLWKSVYELMDTCRCE